MRRCSDFFGVLLFTFVDTMSRVARLCFVWTHAQLQLRVKPLEELRESYRELSPELHQTGLDDRGGFGEDRCVHVGGLSPLANLPCRYLFFLGSFDGLLEIVDFLV